MASGNITKNIKYISSLNDFVNDVKPYHSKLTEIEESIYFSDSMSVKITEDIFRTAISLNSIYSQNIFGNGTAKTIYSLSAPISRGRSEYGVGARVYTVTSSTEYSAADIIGLSARHSSYLAPNSDGILSVSVNHKIHQLGFSVFRSRGVISLDIDSNGGNPRWRETLSPETDWKLPDQRTIEIAPTATSQTWSLIKIDPIATSKILFNGVGLNESTATSIDYQPNINIDPYSLLGATTQTWAITAISTTTFSVVGSVTGAQTDATVGKLYDGQFRFTIPTTKYTFSPGDVFSFSVLSNQPNYLVYGSESGMLAPAAIGIPYDTTYEPATPISFTIPLPRYIGPNGQTGTTFSVGTLNLTFLSPPRVDAEDENFIIRAIDSTTCDVYSSLRGHLPGAIVNQTYADQYVTFMVTGSPNRGDEIRFSVSKKWEFQHRFGHNVFIFGEAQYSSSSTELTSTVTAVTNSDWGSFMNTYAVWNNGFIPEENTPYIFNGVFTASTSGSKILEIAGDNFVKVRVNGTEVATTTNYVSSNEIAVSFNSGTNILSFEVTNSPPAWDPVDNPAGFAATIRDTVVSPILWDTRSNSPYHAISTTATIGKVTSVSSTLHAYASEILLKQYLNDKLYFRTALPSDATTFTASSVIPIMFQSSQSPGEETQSTIKLLNPIAGQNVVGTLTLASNVLSLTNNFVNTFLPLNKPFTIEFEQQGNYVDRLAVKIVDQLIFRLDFPKANKLSFEDLLLATRNLGYDSVVYDVDTPPFSLIYPPDILQNEGFEIIGITTSTYSPSHALMVSGNQIAAFSSLTNSTVIISDIPRSGLYGVTNVVFNGTTTDVVLNRPLTDVAGNTDVIGKRVYTDRSLAISGFDRHLEIISPDPELPLDTSADISTPQICEASVMYDLNYIGPGFDSGAFDSTIFDSPLLNIIGEVIVALPPSFNFGDAGEEELAKNEFLKNKNGCYAVINPSAVGLNNVLLDKAKISYLGENLTVKPKLYLMRDFADTEPYELDITNKFSSSIWKSFTTAFPDLISECILLLVI